MEVSRRRAWLYVQHMNEAAGELLVEAAQGGRTGGTALLTRRDEGTSNTYDIRLPARLLVAVPALTAGRMAFAARRTIHVHAYALPDRRP